MSEGVNQETKFAIDQLIEARKYVEEKCFSTDDRRTDAVWDGYLTLVHALYTPVENYSVSIDPPALKQKPAEAGEDE